MNGSEERRQYHRYSVDHLSAKVMSSFDFSGELAPKHLETVDFNRYGIGLETKESYSVGEVLKIQLCNELESCAEIKGLVCNRIPTGDGYRIGIRFESENDQAASDVMLLLEREVMGLAS